MAQRFAKVATTGAWSELGASYIHSGAKRKAGVVLVPLCGPCKTTSAGSAKVSAAVVKALQSGDVYVNVHTSKNPNGEIRGQIGM